MDLMFIQNSVSQNRLLQSHKQMAEAEGEWDARWKRKGSGQGNRFGHQF